MRIAAGSGASEDLRESLRIIFKKEKKKERKMEL